MLININRDCRGVPHREQEDAAGNNSTILANSYVHIPISNAVGTWTHTFGPNILNEARFGASWMTISTGTSFNPAIGNLGTQLGIANANTSGPGLLLLGFGGGTSTEPLTGTLANLGSNVVDSKFADTVVQFDDGSGDYPWQACIQSRFPAMALPPQHLLQRQ